MNETNSTELLRDSHEPMAYEWAGPARLQNRKPYSFARFGGEGFLRAWTHSRAAYEETLIGLGAVAAEETAGLEQLSRDADATHPDRLAALSAQMDELQEQWKQDIEAGLPTQTGPLLESIVSPYLAARVPLQPRAMGPTWAHDCVIRLLERFEAFGCVHAAYDPRWRKKESSPNEPASCVRLALAAGWLSWSELIVDPPAALAHLNVLLKLNDLIEAGVHHGEWKLDALELRWALAALQLEERLVAHWRRSRGTVH